MAELECGVCEAQTDEQQWDNLFGDDKTRCPVCGTHIRYATTVTNP